MTTLGPCCRRTVSLQELAEGGFFFQAFLRFRIERLHVVEFVRRQLWEMANEMGQFPTVLVLCWVTLSSGRHGGEADIVVDQPEDLTVRHRLDVGKQDVSCFGVDMLADGRLAAPIVCMATAVHYTNSIV